MMAAANTCPFTTCSGALTSRAFLDKEGPGKCSQWTSRRPPWASLKKAALHDYAGKRGTKSAPPHSQSCPQCTTPQPQQSNRCSTTDVCSHGVKTTRRRALIAESVASRKVLSTSQNSSVDETGVLTSRRQELTSTSSELTLHENPLTSQRSRRSLLFVAFGALMSAQLIPPVLAEPSGGESIAAESRESGVETGSIRKKLEAARNENSSEVPESATGAVRKKLDAARKEEAGKDSVKVEVYKDERRPTAKDEVLDDYEKKLLTYNRKIQKLNNAPRDFPGFIREGYDVRVVTSSDYKTSSSGLLYRDYDEGSGPQPEEGQQVVFHYTGYNESGKRVDSSYQQNRPSETRIGIKGMIPGFEEGIKTMRVGGKRRVIVPPDLGPPTGPSTFFSAKQFEVFDIELLGIKNCKRRQIGFYSDLVCDDVVAEIPAELK